MLEAHPEIDPGDQWPAGRELPDGFRLDTSGRIWPIAVRKGKVPPDEQRCTFGPCETTGERCTSYRMKGKDCCRMHGAKQRAGIAHPNATAGQSLQKGIFGDLNLPQNLKDFYTYALEDPTLLDLRHQIAMLTYRQGELLEALHSGRAEDDWREVAKLVQQLRPAILEKNADTKAQKLNKIVPALEQITSGQKKNAALWVEYRQVGESIRRLNETQRKREHDMKMVVNADQLRGILRAFTVIVFRELNGIPATIRTLVKNEGTLDTGRLVQVLTARIGDQMDKVAQNMKGGRLSDEHLNGQGVGGNMIGA